MIPKESTETMKRVGATIRSRRSTMAYTEMNLG
jgi:hypothetical protein